MTLKDNQTDVLTDTYSTVVNAPPRSNYGNDGESKRNNVEKNAHNGVRQRRKRQ